MAFDGIVVANLVHELKEQLLNGRIAKIAQPEADELLGAFIIFVVSVVYRMESITNFSLPLLAGLISGCYSSICIAGPLWVWWEEHREKIQKRKTGQKRK